MEKECYKKEVQHYQKTDYKPIIIMNCFAFSIRSHYKYAIIFPTFHTVRDSLLVIYLQH